jgi:hypothetical protein
MWHCFEVSGLSPPTDGQRRALACLIVELMQGSPEDLPMTVIYEFAGGKLKEFSRRSTVFGGLYSSIVVRDDGSIIDLAELHDPDANMPRRTG